MTKYETLIAKAEKDGAKVIEIDFGTLKKCGKCVDNLIFINSALSQSEKYEILLEELGHYKTTFGDISKQNTINDKKQEFKARRWGFQHGVSLEGIIEAYENKCIDKYEVAEYLGVTDKYLNECIQDYKQRFGVMCKLGKYYIVFEPNLGIYKRF